MNALNELFEEMARRLAETKDVKGVFQFTITSKNTTDGWTSTNHDNWIVDTTGGVPKVEAGVHQKPDATITCSDTAFTTIMTGQADIRTTVMTASIGFSSQKNLALKLLLHLEPRN